MPACRELLGGGGRRGCHDHCTLTNKEELKIEKLRKSTIRIKIKPMLVLY
jgi:hypothetical protein